MLAQPACGGARVIPQSGTSPAIASRPVEVHAGPADRGPAGPREARQSMPLHLLASLRKSLPSAAVGLR